MELPLGGPALRHYTQSRPRPHRQKLNYRPSRPQETIIESENESLEFMGRVDEGVEEFFTKRVLPAETLKEQDDEEEEEEIITEPEVAPASSAPCPPPTKTLRRKLGDFFTLRKRRGLKTEPSQEGRPKKASIADLIRPLREVAKSEKEKDKDRVKEQDKENEKEKVKDQPSTVSGESAAKETPASGAPPLRADAAPPRRALREGKSQSLILLSGSAAAGSANGRNTAKKQIEGQHSFEQKLHLMLQRIGVSKPQPGETTQNQEGEMKKAESEGTIIDSKPEPPPTFSKPRTMSASSDTRHQIRASVSAHEAAGKPALLPKPVIKPGPPPTTSGRITPDTELAQIEEAETNTPTKASPASVPSAPDLTATVTPSVPTISNALPDSIDLPGSSSSTVAPPDTDICIDSVNITAKSPTKDSVDDGKVTTPESSAPTIDPPTTLTTTDRPIESLATVSVTPPSSEIVTVGITISSTSSTTVGPSDSTMETVSALTSESSVSTTSTNLPIKSPLPEQKADATPAASSTAASDASVHEASPPSTSTLDMPQSLTVPIISISEASDDSTSVSLVTETSSPAKSSDITTPAVSQETPITSSSTMASTTVPPTTSCSSSAAESTSSTSSNCMNSDSPSSIVQPAATDPGDISAPSTSSSDTNPTDTTSTATSLNHADTTSTTSSATTMAVSSALNTDSENADTDSAIPALPSPPAADKSSATSQHVTRPAPSNEGSDRDSSLCPEEKSQIKPAEKDTGEKEQDNVQGTKVMETDEKQKAAESENKSDSKNEKQTLDNSGTTRKDVKEESLKAGEDTAEDEQRIGKGVTEGTKQEETKSVSDK